MSSNNQAVSVEDQAALAIVFEENIRDLVRKHLRDALEDASFMGTLNNTYPLMDATFRYAGGNQSFINIVKQAIITQMNKY
jgi:hypothetical protein